MIIEFGLFPSCLIVYWSIVFPLGANSIGYLIYAFGSYYSYYSFVLLSKLAYKVYEANTLIVMLNLSSLLCSLFIESSDNVCLMAANFNSYS